jgi:hypothetical protein
MKKSGINTLATVILLIIVLWVISNANTVAHILSNMSAIGK